MRSCLGWRLVWFLAVSLVVLLGASNWLSMRLQRQQLERQLEDRAVDLGEAVLFSTEAAMLANDWGRLREDIGNMARSDRVVAVRLIRTDGEVAMSTRTEDQGRVFKQTDPACEPCHRQDPPFAPASVREGLHVYRRSRGEPTMKLVLPILNAPSCSSASCHAHEDSPPVLGLLDLELSTAAIEASLATQLRNLIWLDILTLLVVCGAVGMLSWRLVHRPLHEILQGTRRAGSGDLSHRLREDRIGELRDLAISFNQMSDNLQEARGELTLWNERLEKRVAEKTRELDRARDHMVFTEKMVSLGRLASVVAHEINNPLAGILLSVKVLRRRLARICPDEAVRGDVDSSLAMMQRETARSGDIVRNLLFFSRQRDPSLASADLPVIIKRAMGLIDHQANLQEVTLRLEAGDDVGDVVCDANQIEQAGLIALMNALDAMPGGGELDISIRNCNPDEVCVEFRDTGHGIPEELRLKVFEPFFSTKEEGKGTGLGLSVLFGIVQRHGGRVELESEEGVGTLLRLRLPRVPDPVTFSQPEAMT